MKRKKNMKYADLKKELRRPTEIKNVFTLGKINMVLN